MSVVASPAVSTREPTAEEVALLPSGSRILLLQLESILGRIGLITIATTLTVSGLIALLMAINVITENGGAISWALLPYFAIAQAIVMCIALFLPGAAWAGLPPDRRGALHALPVDRRRHELFRVGAGAVILAASGVVVNGMALLLHFRLLPPATPLPSLGAFALGAGSLMVAYLLASLGGLLTRSAIGNLFRVVVYGYLGSMTIAVLSQRYAWMASGAKWFLDWFIGGRWGIGSALLAGSQAIRGNPQTTVHPSAVGLWLIIGVVLVGTAAGRLPRRGRG